tara:strand:+ start:5815 stop:6030 length:216 start_codon:yes stop_codon:yes gene_type:complete
MKNSKTELGTMLGTVAKNSKGQDPYGKVSGTKDKEFTPHMMYKGTKGIKADTYKKHLELKEKGYTHNKPKK